MQVTFALIHSPLIGPFSWRSVAKALRSKGHIAMVASLLPVLNRSDGYANAIGEIIKDSPIRASPEDPIVLVAHSAAGAYMPMIGDALQRDVSAYAFVDARLPSNGESLSTQHSNEEVEYREEFAQDGMLPAWPEGFGPEATSEILPDEDIRKAFISKLQPIPLRLFEEQISYSSIWPDAPCGYIQLSEFYKPLAQEALTNGWPVIRIDADHLHMLKEADEMISLLSAKIYQLEIPRGLESGRQPRS